MNFLKYEENFLFFFNSVLISPWDEEGKLQGAEYPVSSFLSPPLPAPFSRQYISTPKCRHLLSSTVDSKILEVRSK